MPENRTKTRAPAVPSTRGGRTLPAVDSIEIVVAPEDVERAGGLMWASGVAGIEERDEPDGRVRLIAGVPPEHADNVAAALGDSWEVTRGRLDPDQWTDSWKPYARAARIGDGIVVQPPWVAPIAGPGDLVISLDPGRAWGHGAHPSTLLAAEDLVALGTLERRAVLDVGCGSGLLSILAALRRSHRVVALDVDPAAVEATLANAMVNGVGPRVEVSSDPVATVAGPFDVVVANIGLGVLEELAPAIGRAVATDGVLVLSGLLDEQVDAVVAAYPAFRESSRRELEGWASVVLRP